MIYDVGRPIYGDYARLGQNEELLESYSGALSQVRRPSRHGTTLAGGVCMADGDVIEGARGRGETRRKAILQIAHRKRQTMKYSPDIVCLAGERVGLPADPGHSAGDGVVQGGPARQLHLVGGRLEAL